MKGLGGGGGVVMGKLPATNAVRLQCPDFFFVCVGRWLSCNSERTLTVQCDEL